MLNSKARLQLVMKSGKYSLGYKTTLKTLRQLLETEPFRKRQLLLHRHSLPKVLLQFLLVV